VPLTDELRRRLDVPTDLVPDALLDQSLAVAGALVAPWTDQTLIPNPHQGNIDEATVQLAVKLWDVQARGATSMDVLGGFAAPAPSATPGLVRSVFGALGPAMLTGGVSV
jgi:hypothetical protein